MRLYQLKIVNKNNEIVDLAICYARSKEDAIEKFEKFYIVKENQVEEVFFNLQEIAILTEY